MASLTRAIGNWFREKKDEAAESISDPVRDAKYDIEDSETQIKEFESKIQALMKANNNLKRDRQDSAEEIKKWEGLARKAAAAGNRDDVQSCVTKKQTAQVEVEQYAKDILANDKTIAELRAQLGKARNKIAKAKSNTAVLSARLSSAKLRTNLAAGARGLGDGPLSRSIISRTPCAAPKVTPRLGRSCTPTIPKTSKRSTGAAMRTWTRKSRSSWRRLSNRHPCDGTLMPTSKGQ